MRSGLRLFVMTPDLEQPPFCDIFPHFLNSPAEFTLTIPQVSTQGLLFTTRICPSLAQTAIISERSSDHYLPHLLGNNDKNNAQYKSSKGKTENFPCPNVEADRKRNFG